jgi:Tfp pilus assembly protein PilX
MIRPLPANPRRGFSLTVVLVFLILMLALWGTVYRTTSSVLRIETNRVLQQSLDPGALNALAQALQLLQYGTPSDPTNANRTQFTYGLTLISDCGTAQFIVVYTGSPNSNRWQIQVSPGSSAVALPSIASPIVWVPSP